MDENQKALSPLVIPEDSSTRLLRRTLDSIATPCSVKARGRFLVPHQLDVTICDTILQLLVFYERFSFLSLLTPYVVNLYNVFAVS